jgi:hypothetical protein
MPLHERNFPCQKANLSDEPTIYLILAASSRNFIGDGWKGIVLAYFVTYGCFCTPEEVDVSGCIHFCDQYASIRGILAQFF